jgi:hypothetical protein
MVRIRHTGAEHGGERHSNDPDEKRPATTVRGGLGRPGVGPPL